MTPADERPVFIITLRPEADVTEPIHVLRAALKVLLRRFGLRCIDLRETQK